MVSWEILLQLGLIFQLLGISFIHLLHPIYYDIEGGDVIHQNEDNKV